MTMIASNSLADGPSKNSASKTIWLPNPKAMRSSQKKATQKDSRTAMIVHHGATVQNVPPIAEVTVAAAAVVVAVAAAVTASVDAEALAAAEVAVAVVAAADADAALAAVVAAEAVVAAVAVAIDVKSSRRFYP